MLHLEVAPCDFQQRLDDKEASRLKAGSVREQLTCHEGFVCCQLPPSRQLEGGKKDQ